MSNVMQVMDLRDRPGPWPTLDPFLFCVHHHDDYPAGNTELAPDSSTLRGRSMGSDFSGKDGWSMYHGSVVPGFPQHPHRGFETISYVRNGLMDHADSLGAAARFGRGDVQWMTAGAGIVHAEMFPLLKADEPNPMELFQIWINLPARDKMVDPYFTMLWDEDVPKHTDTGVTVTVIAGALAGHTPATPPPNSWAARAEGDVAIWHVTLDDATFTLPKAGNPESNRVLYVFGGGTALIDGTVVPSNHAAVVNADAEIELRDLDGQGAEVLMLQGRPIGEPVAQYGPFVMNDEAGIRKAFMDYRETGFGGWPWPSADPNHGPERGRFARHVDGRVEEPDTVNV